MRIIKRKVHLAGYEKSLYLCYPERHYSSQLFSINSSKVNNNNNDNDRLTAFDPGQPG